MDDQPSLMLFIAYWSCALPAAIIASLIANEIFGLLTAVGSAIGLTWICLIVSESVILWIKDLSA